MKTLTAREAKNSFGELLDMAQREPVVVTKRGRPVSVMVSIEEMQELTSRATELSPQLREGIEQGLADSKTGRVIPVTTKGRSDFVKNIVKNLAHNK
jgi:prevent-host-death family protein